jgi:hypothetical protein
MRLNEIRRPQLDWHKSSFCASGECLEFANQNGLYFLRNSTQPRTVISCTPQELDAFAKAFGAGEVTDPR